MVKIHDQNPQIENWLIENSQQQNAIGYFESTTLYPSLWRCCFSPTQYEWRIQLFIFFFLIITLDFFDLVGNNFDVFEQKY